MRWLTVQPLLTCSWLRKVNYLVEVEHRFLFIKWTYHYVAAEETCGSWEWWRLEDKRRITGLTLATFLDNAVHEARLGMVVGMPCTIGERDGR